MLRNPWFVFVFVRIATFAGLNGQEPKQAAEQKVTEIPAEVVKKFKLDTEFYKKHIDYKGFSILSSAKVSDAGLLEARYLIDKLLGEREDILKAMIKSGCRFMVMAPTEMTTDVPEQRHMKNDPKTNWDTRARGLGGKLSSCGEENLLNLKGDRYRQENILIHEFNHAIHQHGLRTVDPTFNARLKKAYDKAKAAGLWKDTYVIENHSEYWAEGRRPISIACGRNSAPTRARSFRNTIRSCSLSSMRSSSNRNSDTSATTSAGRGKRRRIELKKAHACAWALMAWFVCGRNDLRQR